MPNTPLCPFCNNPQDIWTFSVAGACKDEEIMSVCRNCGEISFPEKKLDNSDKPL